MTRPYSKIDHLLPRLLGPFLSFDLKLWQFTQLSDLEIFMFLLDSVRPPDIKVLKPAVAMVWLLFCGLMVSGVQAGPRWRARDQKCPGRSLINFIPTARRIPTSSPHQNHCNHKHRFFIEIFILSIWQLPYQHTQQHRNTLPQKPKVCF